MYNSNYLVFTLTHISLFRFKIQHLYKTTRWRIACMARSGSSLRHWSRTSNSSKLFISNCYHSWMPKMPLPRLSSTLSSCMMTCWPSPSSSCRRRSRMLPAGDLRPQDTSSRSATESYISLLHRVDQQRFSCTKATIRGGLAMSNTYINWSH